MTQTQTFDFDVPVNRRGTGCLKWNTYGEDVLPMWVADMDFRCPPAVLDALHERVEHGIFGYMFPQPELKDVIVERMARLYDWHITPEDVLLLPGVISGINITAQAVAQDGAVLIQTPVYPPFYQTGSWSKTRLQKAPLTYTPTDDGFTYTIDFDAFENSITPETRMFLLCNPHNPVGRAWTEDELQQMADICQRHDVYICSDEIHGDLIVDENVTHIPVAALSPDAAQRTVTLIAPSKTYNIPGLSTAVAIIQNPELRQQFMQVGAGTVMMVMGDSSHPFVNMMGYTATEAAYRCGDEWLEQALAYIRANRDYAREYIRQHMPELKTANVEGTYLLWVDCRAANLPEPPGKWFTENARVALNEGRSFGEDGAGFVRMNLACTRDTLTTALERMHEALASRA